MYIIIVGAGAIGTSFIDIAVREKNNVVVIEIDPTRAKEISSKYDISVLNADATLLETMHDAEAERADALITTTSDDATNLMIISIGEDLKIPCLVSIVNDKGHVDFFRKLGAHVMENPEEVIANHLYNVIKHPRVQDFTPLNGGAQVFRSTITAKSKIVGQSLRECGRRGLIPASVLIVSIAREGKTLIPSGNTVVQPGDLVTIFSSAHIDDKLIEELTG
ncbi:TrkA family potassium uptake protein [Candidatus Acetothermia bacterium]|nr:TrkA family potassium uptake protein [Candidatus Acetothermia bacterium]